MKIQLFDSKYSEEWDEFVRSSPTGTCYHLSGWGYVLIEVCNFRSFSIMAVNNSNKITGILPLFLIDKKRILLDNSNLQWYYSWGSLGNLKHRLERTFPVIRILPETQRVLLGRLKLAFLNGE